MSGKIIVLGASAGGIQAIGHILHQLQPSLAYPMVIVQHMKSDSPSYYINSFNKKCPLPVEEAQDKATIQAGHIYVAPPGYHLLINEDRSFSLSIDEPIHYSRPSIDVLFESAADAYEENTLGIILTGANQDGAEGLKKIKDYGGLTLVQDPHEADTSFMPKAAIEKNQVDSILTLDEIAKFINEL